MPLLRYFLVVGAGLLGLLFVLNAAYPTEPLPSAMTTQSDVPAIRIQSARKLPERMVFDTSAALPGRTPGSSVALLQSAPIQPKPDVQAQVTPAPVAAEVSAKARVREAFAQLPQDQDALEPRMGDMATVVVPDPKMYPARQPVKHKAVARARPSRPEMLVAQQPRSGLFNLW